MDVLARPFAAVLFDMDGTLISSIDSVVRAWRRLAQEFTIPAARFGDFHGIPAKAVLDLLMPDRPAGERQRALARITALEIADVAGVTALPGAAEALGALAPGGRCAVVTSASGALARARLAASGLPVPAVVVTADDVHRGKPDPEPFTVAAARLGVDPASCLVVEDATSGIAAARAAGAATVAVTTTTPGIQADVVVPDLAALWFSVGIGGVVVRWAPEQHPR